MEDIDVVIIGAGPAGLTAATYLARFRRRVVVLDGGSPRAALIPKSHNTPGFPAGVSGSELMARLRIQASEHGAAIRETRAEKLSIDEAGVTTLVDGGSDLRAPFAVLAAGVTDKRPQGRAGLDAAIARGLVRFCPICDGYEARDQRIAVLGEGAHGLREALFLTAYSKTVTLAHSGADDLPAELVSEAQVQGVEIASGARSDGIVLGERTVEVCGRTFDCLYLALGCETPEIARALPLARDDIGALVVDRHQQTSLPRLYAAGDLVRGLSQIAVAAGEAAIAATAIHRRLREGGAGGT
ncbi:MAG: NAD(P)/FAD-dependent oxidoreductase [Caulobacteraceae bacterium]|nr:NAD(P)/FAD-dependent oxidoreductase [Caulobacteraceae bacterium]